MRAWDQLRMWLQMLGRGRAARQLDDEMRFHLAEQTAENARAGMAPDEARQAAMRAFGNAAIVREQTAEKWHWTGTELLLRDVRYALRRLGRSPGFSLAVVGIMALGLGAVVALFTVVHAVLLRPLPFPQADRLVEAYEVNQSGHETQVAGGNFVAWQAGSHSFAQLAMAVNEDLNLAGASGQLPERVAVELADWNMLTALGVQPVLGRAFVPADDTYQAPQTAMISYSLWQRRFGGSPTAVGRSLLLNAKGYTIVGVLPVGMRYPDAKTQVWIPLLAEFQADDLVALRSHDAHNFHVFGRLKPGVPLEQAQAELSGISAQEARQFPSPFSFGQARLRPLLDAQVHGVRTELLVLLGATACLLLIACLNITGLLLARAATVRREGAIRTALGSSRLRRMRTSLVETLLLSLAGSVLGTALAYAALAWLRHARADLPRVESIQLDGMALCVAITVAVLCGLLAGFVPVAAEKDEQLLRALHESSRSLSSGRPRLLLRRVLIVGEISLTVVLLVGAGLLLKSYAGMRALPFGCNPRHVLTMDISLPAAQYPSAGRTVFFDELLRRVRALPGVQAAGASTALPGSGGAEDDGYSIEGDPPLPKEAALDADINFVDPGYLQAMGIPLLRGRGFAPGERGERNHYALISASLAHTIFKGRDPIGRRIVDGNNSDPAHVATSEIVGIVGDTRLNATREIGPMIYYPLYGGLRPDVSLAVRTFGDPLAASEGIQKVVAGMDPMLAVADVVTMEELIGSTAADTSFEATLLLVFAVVSLVLAAAGLFGVLSYLVATRMGELGIRMALGAQRGQILWGVLRDGLQPAVLGVVVGMLASAALARVLASLLYGTSPLDAVVFVTVPLCLLLVAALACLLPAWRASRLDVMETLRLE